MKIETFLDILGADFYTGVPDSQLKALCNYLMNTYGTDPKHHIIAANEGNCTAIAAGYHLATGKVPVVYMQNSGEGNIINPAASLLNQRVYGIPVIFVVGWRGEPGIHDEPQHIYQGEITQKLLEDMEISSYVVTKDTSESELRDVMARWQEKLKEGFDTAFIISKGALTYDAKAEYHNQFELNREEVIRHIAGISGDDPIVSTTGKISRELFEIREQQKKGHGLDFLTVGSMGHASSIALGIALQKPEKTVWCIDGDGAVLMHMGAMAVIGASAPKNLIHVVINNSAHETVGGMPTAAGKTDLCKAAEACGYRSAVSVSREEELKEMLPALKEKTGPCFVEIKCALGSRDDLGRPTTTPKDNKTAFMKQLSGDEDR